MRDPYHSPPVRKHIFRQNGWLHSFLTAAFTLDQYAYVTDRMKKESAARMDAFVRQICR